MPDRVCVICGAPVWVDRWRDWHHQGGSRDHRAMPAPLDPAPPATAGVVALDTYHGDRDDGKDGDW